MHALDGRAAQREPFEAVDGTHDPRRLALVELPEDGLRLRMPANRGHISYVYDPEREVVTTRALGPPGVPVLPPLGWLRAGPSIGPSFSCPAGAPSIAPEMVLAAPGEA
jgi:hypothetical protein